MRTFTRSSLALLSLFASAQRYADAGLRRTEEVLEFTFQHTPTDPNEDVYVLGSVPELGGGDLRRATRMLTSDRSNWTLRVSLPRGLWFRYRFVARNTIAASLNDRDNGTPLSPHFVGRTYRQRGGEPGKSVQLHSQLVDPVIHWRHGDEEYSTEALRNLQPGRTAGEVRWGQDGFGRSAETTRWTGSTERTSNGCSSRTRPSSPMSRIPRPLHTARTTARATRRRSSRTCWAKSATIASCCRAGTTSTPRAATRSSTSTTDRRCGTRAGRASTATGSASRG